MIKILFLCTGNSCRSIMAEAISNDIGHNKFIAYSAGSMPTGEVHPFTIKTLTSHSINTDDCESKSWNNFLNKDIDLVITVCDAASSETCPVFPGKPVKAHWSIPDPASYKGAEDQVKEEFRKVYSMLELRIKKLIRLDFKNTENLRNKVNEIGDIK